MSNPNYTLEIISHHPKFDKKSLRQYYVDGINTVGAWGDEPFEIVFKNHSWQKVQVKLSIDGTDILTGDKADTKVSDDMWVVNGYGTLNIKAWPETSNGGAQLIFTSANNSVAVHTHGDLSSRGIIAAAVFTEGHVEPVRLSPPVIVTEEHHHHHYPKHYSNPFYYPVIWYNTIGGNTGGLGSGNATFNSSNVLRNSQSFDSVVSNSINIGDASGIYTCDASPPKELESLAAVGAGEHVDQKITYVTGLIKPTLSETVRVRYMWWDDLVAKLKERNVPAPHASGFPGDKKQHIMSLGNTPRIGSFSRAFPREQAEPMYSRI
jgi:hypothetical protein